MEERVRDSGGAIPATATTRYVWSPVYIDAMIARDQDADSNSGTGTGGLEQRIYALEDANWNTTAIVAATGVLGHSPGHVIYRFAYTPYGQTETVDASWGTPASPLIILWSHLFQGLKFDDTTGLGYVRNRDYSAGLGRFIERDPVGFAAGDNNWYRSLANNPTRYVDPSGLMVYIPSLPKWSIKPKIDVNTIGFIRRKPCSEVLDPCVGLWKDSTGFMYGGRLRGTVEVEVSAGGKLVSPLAFAVTMTTIGMIDMTLSANWEIKYKRTMSFPGKDETDFVSFVIGCGPRGTFQQKHRACFNFSDSVTAQGTAQAKVIAVGTGVEAKASVGGAVVISGKVCVTWQNGQTRFEYDDWTLDAAGVFANVEASRTVGGRAETVSKTFVFGRL